MSCIYVYTYYLFYDFEIEMVSTVQGIWILSPNLQPCL